MKSKIVFIILFISHCLNAQVKLSPTSRIDWASFLSQHDLVWEQLPPNWNAGAFTGNGELGMVIYANLDSNRMDFHLARVDVTDHRKAPDKKTSAHVKGISPNGHLDFPRLDIGRMALYPSGKIISGNMRQHLWNAEITGEIVTNLGTVSFTAITHSTDMVDIIKVTSTEKYPDGKLAPYQWRFLAGNAQAPRTLVFPNEPMCKDYVKNPPPIYSIIGKVSVCTQPLLAGGDYATAWLDKKEQGNHSTIFISTANEIPAANASAGVAASTVTKSANSDQSILITKHKSWWHEFYPKSFLSIPDARMEAFFWIQMYKLGCTTRENGELIDDDGPFFRINQWPYATWDLNVQLSYWPVYASNHLELGTTLINYIDNHFPVMVTRTKGKQLGDMAWLMHNYWWQMRFSADKRGLLESWYPKAEQILGEYIEMMHKGEDGKLHLPEMQSPEYSINNRKYYEDATFNLGLCKWLLNTLIETTEKYGVNNNQLNKWKETKEQLTPFLVDKNGLMIGKDQSFNMSHRHFSHLLSQYPLFVLSPDNKEDKELVEKSVNHWFHIENGRALAGYSFTGAASLFAAIGEGDSAYNILSNFLKGEIAPARIATNTMYLESQGKNPTIETPFNGAAAIMDFLFQSWGNKLRIFPATPTVWKDAEFENLIGLGGFEVSAKKEGGKTKWVRIKSNAGETCVIKVDGWDGNLESTLPNLPIKLLGNGEYEISLQKNQSAILYPKGSKPNIQITPLKHEVGSINGWGFKKGMVMPPNEMWPEK